MNTVKIRDIEIGAGAPKIIVPIVGITKEDIIEEAKTFDSIPAVSYTHLDVYKRQVRNPLHLQRCPV